MSDSCQQRCQACSCRGRRGFLATLASIAATTLLWPGRAWAKKLAIRLDKVPQLKTVGGSISLKIKDHYVLLFRESDSVVRAVSSICTHKRSLLKYDPKGKHVVCPQHGSLFAADGKVLKGPAQKTLPTFWAKLDREKGRILLQL